MVIMELSKGTTRGKEGTKMKKKTAEHIKVVQTDGSVVKKTVYVDEDGEKYVYNQNGYWKLEEFAKGRKNI